MNRLPIVAVALAAVLGACVQQAPVAQWTPIPRPAPSEATPQGIAYVCEGNKEVTVVYAKNRASVTLANKTWRMEYQGGDSEFRYSDTSAQWTGRDDLAALRENANTARPIAHNCRPTRRIT